MTKHKFLIFAFLPFFLFGDCADCESYKTQVASDCDSILTSCDSAIFDCQTASASAETFAGYYASNSTERVALIQVAESASNAAGTIRTLKSFVQSIKLTAQSLQCSTNNVGGSCDCASYLQDIHSTLDSIKGSVLGISYDFGELLNYFDNSENLSPFYYDGENMSYYLASINDYVTRIFEDFFLLNDSSGTYNIKDFYNLFSISFNNFTNLLNGASSTSLGLLSSSVELMTSSKYFRSIPKGNFVSIFSANALSSTKRNSYLKDILWNGFRSLIDTQMSLNNYAHTNFFQLSSIASSSSCIDNRFSIFNDFVFSSDAPLSMYTDIQTDGSYRDYLTNYYIKVSKGQQSGSDNYTNWFSRIEILLASLVFQDDGTNFVDEAENTSQMENTLSQSVDTLSQAVSLPENVTGKIDHMGQSFLGLLGEWRTIVICNSLPSQFVLCDINLGSQSRDSSAGSSVSSFRLETSLDSGEFRQFLDFCHAVTTILFTMLFVWLSVMLLSFLLASLAKLAQFCYLVYSALFGG